VQFALLAIDDEQLAVARPFVDEATAVIDEFALSERPAMAGAFAVSAFVHARLGSTAQANADLKQALFLLSMFTGVAPWLAVEARLVAGNTALLVGDVELARLLAGEAGTLLPLIPDGDLLKVRLQELETALQAHAQTAGQGASLLTPAEMRVLRYLPTDLSFGAIAEELFISRNTVKTHAIAIYRKLGVSSRSPAVVEARSLGLIAGVLLGT
jgi:LuxR family maltose regulon positive regulatory protein